MNDPVRDEIDFHIEERTRELVREGVPLDEARRRARASFGDVDRIGAEVGRLQRRRERRAARTALADALRHAFRSVTRHPGYAAIVTGTLGLGIGATVAIFSLVDAVLLSPLPFAAPERLVRVLESDAERPERNPAPADFLDLRSLDGTFDAVAASVVLRGNLLGDGQPERIRYADVSANYFETLGVTPAAGRTFGGGPVAPGTRWAVVSHELWRQRWGGDPGIVGRSVDLDGTSHEIVGVAPEGLRYPADVALWTLADHDVPAAGFFGSSAPEVRDAWYHTVVARLTPGVSLDVAGDRVAALAAALRDTHPETFGDDGEIWLRPLHVDQVGDLRSPLLLLLGATALVLLIVAANVANLALVRAVARAREWRLRLALGSSARRLSLLVLIESLLLALAGGALGVVAATAAVEAARPVIAPLLPPTTELGVDPAVLAFALLVSVLTAVAFGVMPAVSAARVRGGSALRGSRGFGSPAERRVRDALVSAEVALAVVLVLGAGLLLRSLETARQTDMGFEVASLTTLSVGLPGLDDLPEPAQVERYAELRTRVIALPGVADAAWGQFTPAEVGAGAGLRIQGRTDEEPEISVRWHAVSEGYFATVGMTLSSGRTFDATDRAETERVGVVNETLARRFFPGGDAVGQLVNTGLDGRSEDGWSWVRVVGVVHDARNQGPERPTEPMLYRPIAQQAPGFTGSAGAVLHLRGDGSGPVSIEAVRGAIRSVNADAPVDRILVGQEIVADYFATRTLVLTLLGVFATAALFLGALGIYGLTRFSVQQRAREIGVRVAIGADRGSVVRLVVLQGLTTTGVGLAMGLLLALGASRLIENRLFGVRALDPLTWGTVLLVLGGVSLLASWLPARRAARIDPVEAIRAE